MADHAALIRPTDLRTNKQTKRKEAERRQTQIALAAPRGRMSPPASAWGAARATPSNVAVRRRPGRARLPAFHHGSCLAGFRPFGAAPGQASWDEAATSFAEWALPTPASPSPVTAPHASVVVPRSMMPRAARVRRAKPPAGAALAPRPDMPSGRVLSERVWPLCNYISDNCQWSGDDYFGSTFAEHHRRAARSGRDRHRELATRGQDRAGSGNARIGGVQGKPSRPDRHATLTDDAFPFS